MNLRETQFSPHAQIYRVPLAIFLGHACSALAPVPEQDQPHQFCKGVTMCHTHLHPLHVPSPGRGLRAI